MAALTDLDAKRVELNSATAAYRQAVLDFNAGSITQTQLDDAKSAAQVKGDEYAKLAADVKRDNPGASEDSFFSNPTLMSQQVRADVATIVRNGKLNSGVIDNFDELTLNNELWQSVLAGNGVGLSFYTGDNGGVLRLQSSTRYPKASTGSFSRLLSKNAYPPGTSFKVMIRRVGGYTEHTYLGLISEDQASSYARYHSKNGHSFPGNFLDESGNGGTGPRNDYDEGPGVFTVMELRWVDANTIEWWRDGVLEHTTSNVDFHSNHKFYIESAADSYGNWVAQYVDVEWIEITPP